MNSVDLDGNGTIDYNEFLAATMNRTKIMSKQNLEAAFKMFDKVNLFFKFNLIGRKWKNQRRGNYVDF